MSTKQSIITRTFNDDAIKGTFVLSTEQTDLILQHYNINDGQRFSGSGLLPVQLRYLYGEMGNMDIFAAGGDLNAEKIAAQFHQRIETEELGFRLFNVDGQSLISGKFFDTSRQTVQELSEFRVDGGEDLRHYYLPDGHEFKRFKFAANNWVARKDYLNTDGDIIIREYFDFERHEGEIPFKIEVLHGWLKETYTNFTSLVVAWNRLLAEPYQKLFSLTGEVGKGDAVLASEHEVASLRQKVNTVREQQHAGHRLLTEPLYGNEMRQRQQSINQETDAQKRLKLFQQTFGTTGPDVYFAGNVFFDFPEDVHLGNHFWANHNITFIGGAKITFGNHCLVGPNVSFYTSNHPLNAESRLFEGYSYAKPITIGDNVWIGGSVTILPGTTIGNNAVISAGSVVSGTIPDQVLVAGNPARIIKTIR
ncbi:sugar O-acetyltransferase [Furfurilactobacillus curtus]|uniref:Acetyltransferase n=1 Tax=Furfurilactobacillus curtus TaxID=1746200 RepID=A0ABQ5JT59_9LACO